MSESVTGADPDQSLTSEAYHITVDGGRDSFYALSIERENSETAWLMSDTVRSLAEMR